MKLTERRELNGPHNGTQDSVALPVPSMIKGQGDVRLSWSSHKGADGNDIHSIHFSDEDGKFIALHTLGHQEVRPWDKVAHVLSKFRKNALALMDELNKAI